MLDFTKAPTQEIFDDIKRCSIAIWNTYDNEFWYATEKIDRIKDVTNIRDNALYIVAFFDYINQAKLLALISNESNERLSPFICNQY